MTGEDVACYDSFVFDADFEAEGTGSPHLSRSFASSELYVAASDPSEGVAHV